MKNIKLNKKSITALICALTLATGFFTGCKEKINDKDEKGRTMVSVGNWPQKEGDALNGYNKRKASYEEENPDAVIIPDLWQFELKTFYAKAAGGQLPTVYDAGFTEVAEIINSNYSADITEGLKKRGYDGKFNPQILKLVSKNDKQVFAFPYNAYLLGLAFNTEMFEKAGLMEADGTPKQPKDWNEVAEFAVKIKEATGKAGFVFPSANNNGGWMFTCLAWSFGTKFMEKNSDGEWKATFDSPEAAAALQYIKDLKWKYDVLPSNTLLDGDEYYKQFLTGNAAMMISPTSVADRTSQFGTDLNLVGMMGIPAGPKKHVTLLGGQISAFSNKATADQIDAGLRWLEKSYNYNLNDNVKSRIAKNIAYRKKNNQVVGVYSLSVWNNDTESVKYEREQNIKETNVNINHFRLYNEFVENCPAEIHAEEPVCCQELYGILDSCIQNVLNDKNADCAAIMKKANSDFQANYLDNLDY